jgi:RNA polymerase sigma-70 factor (sigma-E family)
MPHHLHIVADEELEMLVRAHEAALLRLAYLLCRDSARAEDLVQDAFLRVLRRWRSAGVPDQPFAYARKVVINEYLAWRRLRSASEQVGPVADAEAFDHVEQLADRDLMWRLLGVLPARGRTVLVLRFYEELADVEIATILGCRQATVRSISARALQLLRAHPMMAIVLEEA